MTGDSRTATVDGIPMRWEEHGQGVPVILVHGIPTGPAVWRHVMPRVADARCLAWEMVGYASSLETGSGRDISVARQADHLVAWMREVGVERAILAGHDLGGGVAQIVAVEHPERVSGLVFVNTISYDSWPIPPVKGLRAAGIVTERLPNAAIKGIVSTLFRLGHDSGKAADEAMSVHWPFYERTRAAQALLRQVRALDVNDTLAVADRLSEIRVPARLVWGAADQFQKIGYGYRLAYDLKAPLDRVEGGKHFVPEDHPDRVAAAIAEVVAEVRDAPAASPA